MNACDIPALMNSQGVSFQAVTCVDWPDAYPLCPNMAFRIARTDDELLLHYRVTEPAVRAMCDTDGGPVWTDSCAECFLLAADGKTYYNIECSCVGTLLIGCGEGRSNRIPTTPERLATASRWATLGRQAFGQHEEMTSWELALAIPFDLIAGVDVTKPVLANIYKCGDGLPEPHFISCAPINTPAPDFHQLDFFQFLSIPHIATNRL